MAHPKAMYKNSVKGVVEKIAMSAEEEHALSKAGWHGHPEEARLVEPEKRTRKTKQKVK